LKALLGSINTPNLNGMFLRGTGSASSGHTGPTLKTVQQDDLGSHLHAASLPTNSAGSHNHNNNSNFNRVLSMDNKYTVGGTDNNNNSGEEVNLVNSKIIGYDGDHTHTASGNTNKTGGTETRPINYGVNYIIKI
jgi:hypothetical protein